MRASKPTQNKDSDPVPLIIDTDAGWDDVLAISHFLSLWKEGMVEIKGFTIENGNIPAVKAARVVTMICDMMKIKAPPIRLPTTEEKNDSDSYYGVDGCYGILEESKRYYKTMDCENESESAQEFLVRQLNDSNGLVVVAIGPLSNLKLAHELQNGVLSKAKEILIMGGAVDVPGNDPTTNLQAEFNFGYDPEATKIVLETSQNALFFPLDCDIWFKKNIIDEAFKSCENVLLQKVHALFMNQIENAPNGKEYKMKDEKIDLIKIYDPMISVYFEHREIFEVETGRIEVKKNGSLQRSKNSELVLSWVTGPIEEVSEKLTRTLAKAFVGVKQIDQNFKTASNVFNA